MKTTPKALGHGGPNAFGHTGSNAFGYRGWIDAPVDRIGWQFEVPDRIATDAIDAWLVRHAGIAPEDLPAQAASSPADEALRRAAWVAHRILLLTRALQQAGRGPVFHPGYSAARLAQDAESGRWRASAWAPRIDQMPASFTRTALDAAKRCIARLLTGPVTPEATADILERWDRETIPALIGIAGQGGSTVPLLREAQRLGIPFRHLGLGAYQLGWGSRGVIVDRSTTGTDSAFGARFSQNKQASLTVLRLAGLPVPRHIAVRKEDEAVAAAAALGWPVVVKPTDRDRGEGVHVDIREETQLRESFRLSAQVSPRTLIEQQIAGVCHRVFIADNKLLYVVKRLPIGFHADGVASVRQAVEANARARRETAPWDRDAALPLDGLALEMLGRQGLGPDDVPPRGRFVALRPIESTEWGGVDEDLSDAIHPDNVDVALRAAEVLGLRNAGVDIISTDISMAWHANGAAINEVNFAPLLGGGEISRSRISQYLDWIAPGERRIPVIAVLGNAAAWQAGRDRQAQYIRQGLRCWLTSDRASLDASGAPRTLAGPDSVFNRTLALTLDRRVDAIVIVIRTAELLRTGSPVDRLDALIVTDDRDAAQDDGRPALSATEIAGLRAMLERLVRSPAGALDG